MIAFGQYDDAYMINGSRMYSRVYSDVHATVLCEQPAVAERRREAVFDCRLKRVAADNKGDVSDRIPQGPFPPMAKRLPSSEVGLLH